ncbi:hypothetical protein BDV33DRAFT_174504 [Aspergillus novoparasiticus]|uniref:LysM domain-containing protein n=1 Tax=Aspergillus novoparasiticus TaxID=986946 RepID=A0A5N6ERA1_9EURO|nr:hypothetical protein BDV33DRAFT_174504 [Aspergillus novoparasiticus]
MGPQLFLIVGLFLQLLSAHELHPRAGPACQFSVAASYLGETCDTFARRWHIDRATFLSLNPGADCSGLADDRTYCVQPSPSVSATSMATTSSTATSSTILSTTTDSSAVSSSTSTDNSTATSSTTTGSSTATSSTTTDSSTATMESATPTASSESSATSSTIPLQITMIITLLLSLCFI